MINRTNRYRLPAFGLSYALAIVGFSVIMVFSPAIVLIELIAEVRSYILNI